MKKKRPEIGGQAGEGGEMGATGRGRGVRPAARHRTKMNIKGTVEGDFRVSL
jgi:hypothetical protein